MRGERRAHFRGRSRPGRRVDIGYQRADGQLTAAGAQRATVVTANIGVGGAYLLSETPEPVGTQLRIFLEVPDQGTLTVEAEVRRVSKGSATTGAGMGLKFAPLDVAALLSLQNYFSSLLDK